MDRKNLRQRLAPLWAPCIVLGFLFLDISFRSFYVGGWGESLLAPKATLFTLCWASGLTALVGLLPRLAGRIFLGIAGAFFCIIVLVHAAMWNMFGSFFSFSDLMYAGDGAKFFNPAYIQIPRRLILCVILSAALLGAGGVLMPKHRFRAPRTWVCLGILVAACLGGFAIERPLLRMERDLGMSWDIQQRMQAHSTEVLYTEFTDYNRCMPIAGLYQYTLRNFMVSSGIQNRLDNNQTWASLDAYYAGRKTEISGENRMTGRFTGKNALMVMLESIDSWMITEDYMPNLWAVQQQSVNFTNHYTPLYLSAGTFNTEFISLTGIIPPASGVSASAYTDHTFPYSLPNLFREAGYRANSFHAANPAIYNRGEIHQNLGFEAYHNYAQMGMSDYMLDSQLIRAFDLMTEEEPFFSYVITYSGHGAYDESMANISDPHLEAARAAVAKSGVTASEENLREYTLAVAHAMETDAYIGSLMQELERSGLADRTVLIFYADHYSKYLTDRAFILEIKDADNQNLLCNTPMFIWASDLEPENVDKLVSSVDIFPTVCNSFGLKADLSQFVGDDAFGDGGGFVYWRDASWLDSTGYHTISDELSAEELQTLAKVREKLSMSGKTLVSDYFAYLIKHGND